VHHSVHADSAWLEPQGPGRAGIAPGGVLFGTILDSDHRQRIACYIERGNGERFKRSQSADTPHIAISPGRTGEFALMFKVTPLA
jgi:hypothetical protein